MNSEFFPTLHNKRAAARAMATTAEAARVASTSLDASAAASGAPKRTVAEAKQTRQQAGARTPARYYPRNSRGECFSHRVAAILEAEARLRHIESPTWLTSDEVRDAARTALEPGVSVAIGVALCLRPIDAFTDSDMRHFLADHRLPKPKKGTDTTFVAAFDGRPYDRPWYFVGGKWRQTNRKAINNALVQAAVTHGLGSLWIDRATAEGPLQLELRGVAANGDVRYSAIDVDDGSTTTLYALDMLQ